VSAREERIGRNEVLFREINERLKEMQETFDVPSERAEFVCECGDADCTKQITMSIADYERLRADATTFAVVPGHEVPDVETVLERREGYLVVRKRSGEAATLAESADPRA
jgi:hypothetical protein